MTKILTSFAVALFVAHCGWGHERAAIAVRSVGFPSGAFRVLAPNSLLFAKGFTNAIALQDDAKGSANRDDNSVRKPAVPRRASPPPPPPPQRHKPPPPSRHRDNDDKDQDK